MSDTPAQDEPEWWKRLNSETRARLRQIMGDNWRPNGKTADEVMQAFFRKRIDSANDDLKKLLDENDEA